MRHQDRGGMSAHSLRARHRALAAALCAGLFVALTGVLSAQEPAIDIVPRLTGNANPMENEAAPPLARPVVDDIRKMRNYPEQPPVIPHSIEGYQLTLNTNRCMSCHKREFTEGSGAPMISITHFMDRDGQVLGDVTPRRYFCTECHVQQTDAKPLVPNEFVDMNDVDTTP
jgi:cytochrome c-type protein NapB